MRGPHRLNLYRECGAVSGLSSAILIFLTRAELLKYSTIFERGRLKRHGTKEINSRERFYSIAIACTAITATNCAAFSRSQLGFWRHKNTTSPYCQYMKDAPLLS